MREDLPGQEMHRLQEGPVLLSWVPESGLAGSQALMRGFSGVRTWYLALYILYSIPHLVTKISAGKKVDDLAKIIVVGRDESDFFEARK